MEQTAETRPDDVTEEQPSFANQRFEITVPPAPNYTPPAPARPWERRELPAEIQEQHDQFELMQRQAMALASSKLFGFNNHAEALAVMLLAHSEGINPAQAMMEYQVIKGRPSLTAQALQARFLEAGGEIEWLKYEHNCVSAEFKHPDGAPIIITWTIEDAQRAGLTGKDNWRHYPRAMLRARVVAEGVRACYPGCSAVTLTTEENVDIPDIDGSSRKRQSRKTKVAPDDPRLIPGEPSPETGAALAPDAQPAQYLRGEEKKDAIAEAIERLRNADTMRKLNRRWNDICENLYPNLTDNAQTALCDVYETQRDELQNAKQRQPDLEAQDLQLDNDFLRQMGHDAPEALTRETGDQSHEQAKFE